MIDPVDTQPDIEEKTIKSEYGIWKEYWGCQWVMKANEKIPHVSFSVTSSDEGNTWYVLARLWFTIKNQEEISSEVLMGWDSSDDAGIWYKTRDDAIKAVDDAIEDMIYPVRGERK